MLTRRARGWGLTLVIVGVVGLAGCSHGASTSAPTSTIAADQAQPATAAAVAAGLHKIDQIAQDIAVSAGSDKTRAVSLAGEIEPAWRPIEDTVKQHDQDTYLVMEDNFAVLERAAGAGDAAAAARGAAAISPTVQAYLAKYPG